MPQPYIDVTGATAYREATGDGTVVSPYIPRFTAVQQGTWNVSLTGTLPAFAATPTFNIGTAPSFTFTNTSFTANAGTNLNTSLLALESGGNLASINTKLPSNLTVTATRLLVDGSGVTQSVSAASLPLPTGAATATNQTTTNTSLSSIDTKTPALGQALAAASVPVVLPAAQITTLTPPTSVGISGTLPAFAATPTFNIGTAPNLTFTNTSFTANAGTNLNTSLLALESGGNLASINTKLPSNLTVTATRLLVDGSGVTQPVSLTTLPALPVGTNNIGSLTNITGTISLPTGAATAANQTTGNTSLANIDGKLPSSLGTKTSSASLSVSPAFAATSTLTNVASSVTSVTLLAANNNRKTVIILNDSTADLYVTLNASAASTTNYSLFLAAKVGNTPSSAIFGGDDYSGEIRGIWSSANGFARITEVV